MTVTLNASANYSATCPAEYLVDLSCPGSGAIDPVQVSVPVGGAANALFTAVAPSSAVGVDLVTAKIVDCEAADSAPYTVVKVASVTHSNPHCWEGGQITFTAIPSPLGAAFPSGCPTWSATSGSFPSGNIGASVAWQAPTGSGGNANITAVCGSSSAIDAVLYVNVTMSAEGDLLRSESDAFSVLVDPPTAPVSLSALSAPPELNTTISGLSVEVQNIINTSDNVAHIGNGVQKIGAALDGCTLKVLNKDYNLKKKFKDWYVSGTESAGKAVYSALNDQVATAVGNAAKAEALAQGFNATRSGEMAAGAKSAAKTWLLLADPFPGTITDSTVSESATYSWSVSSTVNAGAGSISIKQSGYPGYPDVSPPSLSQWKTGINDYGFSDKLFNVEGYTEALTVSASAANWNAAASLSLSCEDPFGSWSQVITFKIWMGW